MPSSSSSRYESLGLDGGGAGGYRGAPPPVESTDSVSSSTKGRLGRVRLSRRQPREGIVPISGTCVCACARVRRGTWKIRWRGLLGGRSNKWV